MQFCDGQAIRPTLQVLEQKIACLFPKLQHLEDYECEIRLVYRPGMGSGMDGKVDVTAENFDVVIRLLRTGRKHKFEVCFWRKGDGEGKAVEEGGEGKTVEDGTASGFADEYSEFAETKSLLPFSDEEKKKWGCKRPW